ncbi:PepSY-associated TM helix domain-containing protein [Longimicrobium sp.]|uniref:PepSY-associated TM helix domain-containing protein n=1 Tax=Longimicrobium sp. TaxID=2029185 RepID=UPI002E3100D4|nr:PepSY-associated TM helix domain-containing protein [Longimicrobium sp.]HEX6038533.1 PepSY-associated TM helix domain-containing protein [Longimicrobium sp.]
MRLFRKILFWCHLVTGVAVALVVLIMSVTGVLLTYEKQMLAWADARAVQVPAPAPGARPLAVDELMRRVGQAETGTPTQISWLAGENRPVRVAYGREKTIYADPYTGAVLGQGATTMRAFFRKVTDWHRWLAQSGDGRDRGKMITGASNLGFLFLVLSGFYLWWPRTWTREAFRSVTLFRRGLRAKARDFNWHNVIGLWSFVPLLIIVASAVVISYPWASNLVYRLAGEEPPAQSGPGGGPGGPQAQAGRAGAAGERGGREGGREGGGREGGGREGGGAREGGEGRGGGGGDVLAGIDPLLATARGRVDGWRTISLTLPKSADAPVVFNIDRGTGGQPQKRASLTLDRATGAEVKWEPFGAGTLGRRMRSILRFAHTGEVLGIVGQTIAGLVSLGAAVLVWTGLSLSLRRLRAWRGRRARFGPDGGGTAGAVRDRKRRAGAAAAR